VRGRLLSTALSLLILILLLAGWKLYVEVNDVSRFVLPPPEDVLSGTLEVLGEAETWQHLWITLQEILLGFGLALVFGLVTGALLGEVPVLDRALTPYLVFLQVLPKVAVIPLLIVWLGFGMSAKVVIASVFAFFPITVGVRTGIRSVDPGHRDLARVLQADRRQRLWLVELPSALPSILSGMEVGIVLATIGAVVAEFLAGSEGLGWLSVAYLNQLQVDRLFGVIVLLSLLGFVLYALVASLRRVVVPWHQSAVGITAGG
jgi:NitT/TauT family transport system permease protein